MPSVTVPSSCLGLAGEPKEKVIAQARGRARRARERVANLVNGSRCGNGSKTFSAGESVGSDYELANDSGCVACVW